jgi:hypothetical protein
MKQAGFRGAAHFCEWRVARAIRKNGERMLFAGDRRNPQDIL